jgi:hypothetical protein
MTLRGRNIFIVERANEAHYCKVVSSASVVAGRVCVQPTVAAGPFAPWSTRSRHIAPSRVPERQTRPCRSGRTPEPDVHQAAIFRSMPRCCCIARTPLSDLVNILGRYSEAILHLLQPARARQSPCARWRAPRLCSAPSTPWHGPPTCSPSASTAGPAPASTDPCRGPARPAARWGGWPACDISSIAVRVPAFRRLEGSLPGPKRRLSVSCRLWGMLPGYSTMNP